MYRTQSAQIVSAPYREYGDVRPSLDELNFLLDTAPVAPDSTDLATMADLRIDMAMQSGPLAAAHIMIARGLLDDVIDTTNQLIDAGCEKRIEAELLAASNARLRYAELPAWQQAATGEPVSINYLEYLRAAEDTTEYLKYSEFAKSKLIEFIPVLLGARGLFLPHTIGWTGRLALGREDCRQRFAEGHNPNWDLGLILGEANETFDKPIPVQVKTKRSKQHGHYKKSNVRLLIAQRAGFQHPASVIQACTDEAALINEISEQRGWLDIITSKILEQVQQPDNES